MKVNALLLALLAASANAQDDVDPCKAKMESLNTCVGLNADDVGDAPNACRDCVSGKMQEGTDGVDLANLMTNAAASCEVEEATCQACKTDLDAYVACQSAQFTLQVGQEM
mmetsp:Transcript_37554/g.80108  ORF Transcript_37554/g.80108 Transcript_37554/m.80108 type:complete len:111 (+) Transcript_37554:80-412(+)